MPKSRKSQSEKAEVHKDLDGFDIKIDTFGHMDRNTSLEKLRAFLDLRIGDKKKAKEEE